MSRRIALVAAILVPAMAVLGLLAWGFTREPKFIPTPLLAKPAPAFTLTLFDGTARRLEDLHGNVVFLNFWASGVRPAGLRPGCSRRPGEDTRIGASCS